MSNKFYITTAINYTNGSPHFGHAYEAVVADCIARYHRLIGNDVFFLTGTDEHGQKIADTAANQNPPLSPLELCDKYVAEFKNLNNKLNISYDFYIRTTMEKHELCAQDIWKRCANNDDIYLGQYEGWYNKREERFVTETEAQSTNYMDGTIPLIKTSEPSYFFRMGKYQDRLIKHIQDHPEFIFPEEKRMEILDRLKEPLNDLSISRTTFDWGIPVPDSFKGKPDNVIEKHVMYVWFDALTNYLSGVDYPLGPILYQWPADIHLIGKDIAWFHAVIWPCMLFSANISLPKRIVCHGFVNGPDGRKMSKTYGNVIDPVKLLETYTSDTIRYFMLREGTFGADFNCNEAYLQDRYNGELANNFGNLVQRGLNLAKSYCDSLVPSEAAVQIFDLKQFAQKINKAFNNLDIQHAIQMLFDTLTLINKWLTDEAPWNLKGDEFITKRKIIVRTLLEALYAICHFTWVVMPSTSEEIFARLNTKMTVTENLLANSFNSLKPETEITLGAPLFPRLEKSHTDERNKKVTEKKSKK
ncbi:methionyl-tRNA synthetase [Fadolivirus algeromassiliense]|jgi:methionyl-tRNA synthetase|uniref:methionine--tRNA ligase n=1 Tax=Fadolivirus FV1/VV64 TaxID=3070911 RepID=A0A7D3URE4_9VIRU|nr:methionyl-tRNA synthetase [Fadolivirus algeromassiliense]QKF94573.1 methionyl-tRNA synthetase [Fadolivirus FV1/VV64]